MTWPGLRINELVLLTVVVAIKLWATQLQGLIIELYSDNTTYITVINNKSAINVRVQCCLHELWLYLSNYNIPLVVQLKPSKQNYFADSLSHYHVDFTARKLVDS